MMQRFLVVTLVVAFFLPLPLAAEGSVSDFEVAALTCKRISENGRKISCTTGNELVLAHWIARFENGKEDASWFYEESIEVVVPKDETVVTVVMKVTTMSSGTKAFRVQFQWDPKQKEVIFRFDTKNGIRTGMLRVSAD